MKLLIVYIHLPKQSIYTVGCRLQKLPKNYKARVAIGEDHGLIDAEIGYLKGDDVCKINGITGKENTVFRTTDQTV